MPKCSKGLESHFVLLLFGQKESRWNGDSCWVWSEAKSKCSREPKVGLAVDRLQDPQKQTAVAPRRGPQWLKEALRHPPSTLTYNNAPSHDSPSRCCVRLIVPQDVLIVRNMCAWFAHCACLDLSSCDRTLLVLPFFDLTSLFCCHYGKIYSKWTAYQQCQHPGAPTRIQSIKSDDGLHINFTNCWVFRRQKLDQIINWSLIWKLHCCSKKIKSNKILTLHIASWNLLLLQYTDRQMDSRNKQIPIFFSENFIFDYYFFVKLQN